MIITTSTGKVFTGEADQLLIPNTYKEPAFAALFVHGAEAGAGAIDWMSASQYRWPIVRSVVDNCGLIGISADIGGNATWGNVTAQSRMDAMYAYSQTLPNVKKGKVVLIGQSMGGVTSLVWARNNAAKVACLVGVIPVTNLTFAQSSSSYTGAINAAYGGLYVPAVHGINFNPLMLGALLNGIQGRLYAGTTDALARLTDAQALSAAAPSLQTVPIVGGHAESTIGQIDTVSMEQFIKSNLT